MFSDCVLTQVPSPPCFTRSCFFGACCAALPPRAGFTACSSRIAPVGVGKQTYWQIKALEHLYLCATVSWRRWLPRS